MKKLRQKKVDRSIDELLASIRQAINEETERDSLDFARPANLADPANRTPTLAAPAESRNRDLPVSGSMRELRVSLQPAEQQSEPGTVTTRTEDFLALKNKLASLGQKPPPPPRSGGDIAGIMGGEVRLEDALARMQRAGELHRGNAPVPTEQVDTVIGAEPEIVPTAMRAGLDGTDQDVADFAVEPVMPMPEAEYQPALDREPLPEQEPYPEPHLEAVPEHRLMPDHQTDQLHQPQSETELPPIPQVASPVMEPAEIETPSLPVQPASTDMMSNETMAAAASAFDRLTEQLMNRSVGGDQALENAARDMIKPMLKKWLDENLPELVERLVRDEIERVARRGGR